MVMVVQAGAAVLRRAQARLARGLMGDATRARGIRFIHARAEIQAHRG
jgi:hypothetical protein